MWIAQNITTDQEVKYSESGYDKSLAVSFFTTYNLNNR